MKASKFSEAQKAFILKQGADGVPVADICRKAGISAEDSLNCSKAPLKFLWLSRPFASINVLCRRWQRIDVDYHCRDPFAPAIMFHTYAGRQYRACFVF